MSVIWGIIIIGGFLWQHVSIQWAFENRPDLVIGFHTIRVVEPYSLCNERGCWGGWAVIQVPDGHPLTANRGEIWISTANQNFYWSILHEMAHFYLWLTCGRCTLDEGLAWDCALDQRNCPGRE